MPSITLRPSVVQNPWDQQQPSPFTFSAVGASSVVTAVTDQNISTYATTPEDLALAYRLDPTSIIPPGATNIRVVSNVIASMSQPLGDPGDLSNFRIATWKSTPPTGPFNFYQELFWNPSVPTSYSIEVFALNDNATPREWTLADFSIHDFIARANAGAVLSPGFNIHEVSSTLSWQDPILTAPGTPLPINVGLDSADIRIPLPSSIPSCSSTVPITLTVYYTTNPNLTAWTSKVGATFTESYTSQPVLGVGAGQTFIDVDLSGLGIGVGYYVYATLSQLSNVATSPTIQFSTSTRVQPSMTF